MYPLISILIATYNPNIKWLKEQLESVNSQSYTNIEVIILDDCSDLDKYEKINELSKSIIKKFPLQILRNETNLGSNKTFEKLTFLSNGKYIAYCDQDDVWDSNKIELLYNHIKKYKQSLLVYSDMKIIDENNNILSESMSDYRKRHIFFYGKDKFKDFIYRNCVVGCTMMVDREIVLKSIPFLDSMVHDHYIALFTSCFGEISFLNKKLILYRQHGKNQTGVLKGVESRDDYENYQIDLFNQRIKDLKNKDFIKECKNFQKELVIAEKWGNARKIWWNKLDYKSLDTIFNLRQCNLITSKFEILFARVPNFIFKRILKFIKK